MKRLLSLILTVILLSTCFGCFWEHDRGEYGDRDRGGYGEHDRGEHGDRDRDRDYDERH